MIPSPDQGTGDLSDPWDLGAAREQLQEGDPLGAKVYWVCLLQHSQEGGDELCWELCLWKCQSRQV